jgi:hypothetical protein
MEMDLSRQQDVWFQALLCRWVVYLIGSMKTRGEVDGVVRRCIKVVLLGRVHSRDSRHRNRRVDGLLVVVGNDSQLYILKLERSCACIELARGLAVIELSTS